MKNKYFGDTRDLFKYDLILRITRGVVSIHRFLFIPMLTSDDDSGDGGKTNYTKARAGTQNEELMSYLKNCVNESRRNIMEIKPYFESNGVEICIHKELLIHKNRRDYFDSIKIEKEFFSNSLVFVDPDNGLEIQRSKEKHFLYREAKDIYDYTDGNSILMIYQHFPRKNHKEYLCRRANELKNLTGDLPIYISDNEIIFFLLTKSGEVKNQLKRTTYGNSCKTERYNRRLRMPVGRKFFISR
ncbi:hypothetical protein ES703_84870 [subsurface metagenome]